MLEATASPPGVTFCIPNWNHRGYLARSLRSAVAGSVGLADAGLPSEIVVIDDASRDGSQKTLMAMAMTQARASVDVVLLDANRGLGAARNLGVGLGRYRYVCFLDADNEIIAENIPLFVSAMAETGSAVVYGNLFKHDGAHCYGLVSSDYVNDSLLEDNYIDALALCDRDKIQYLGGYDETLKSHEDWELWLHLIAERERIVFVPACFGYYYVNPLSMVQTETKVDFTRFHRIFNQRRSGLSADYRSKRMYYPGVGWLL